MRRKTNLELIRLVSMVLIIAHHFSVHSGFLFTGTRITGNMLFLQLLSIGGKIGVNLFVMLGSWFLIRRESLDKKKLLTLWKTVFFYSLVLYAAACLTGKASLTLGGAGKALLPILSKQWWFASSYFFLYLLSPWLNRFLQKLGRKQYALLLGIVGIFWFLVPVLAWLPERLRDLGWFVYLYSMTGFLRLHGSVPGWSWRRCMCAGGAAFLGLFCLGWAGLYFRGTLGVPYESVYFDAHHILVLLASLYLFLGFERWEMPCRERINALAALSFGVYLLHDSDYFRYPLWRELLKGTDLAASPWLVPYGVLCVALVYLACGGLEALRKLLLDEIGRKKKTHPSK